MEMNKKHIKKTAELCAMCWELEYEIIESFLLKFAKRVARIEREACARAAEDVVPRHTECNKIAAAIRARGQ
jgi:hypothetical protein